MLFCIHIGAHETAGGFIQSTLQDEREAIQRRKMRFLTHGWARTALTSRLDDGDEQKLAKTLTAMVKLHAVRERLVISDENIAGPVFDRSGLYPDIGKRLALLLRARPDGHDFEVRFAIRDYAGFFSSMLSGRPDPSRPNDSGAIREAALGLKRGWNEVVADICDVFGAERTTVWTYDAFLRDPDAIGRALLGDAAPRVFAGIDMAEFTPLTAKGVAVLEKTSDLLGEADYDRLEGAIRRFRFEQPDEAFTVFGKAETDELASRYQRDLEQIRKLGCGLVAADDQAQDPPAVAVSAT